ncbi:hypothetical protein BJX61DRAFT_519976 [Aspergillus egyptiacus]|nr:hypothetical protein BJX61DRAFT_519976 [Aspergillus egyptiacus]
MLGMGQRMSLLSSLSLPFCSFFPFWGEACVPGIEGVVYKLVLFAPRWEVGTRATSLRTALTPGSKFGFTCSAILLLVFIWIRSLLLNQSRASPGKKQREK